jgi:hypothetical protein
MMKLQMIRHAKRAEKIAARKIQYLLIRELFAKIPLRNHASKTIKRRKNLAKRAWALKQSRLIR